MWKLKQIQRSRLRLSLIVALLAAFTSGLFAVTLAQGQTCRDIDNITVCGDSIVGIQDAGPNDFAIVGNLKIGPKDGPPVLAVTDVVNDPIIDSEPDAAEKRLAKFVHAEAFRGDLGADNTVFGTFKLIGDPAANPIVHHKGVRPRFNLNGFSTGFFFVDTLGKRIFSAPANGIPLHNGNGVRRNEGMSYDFLQRIGLSPDFVTGDSVVQYQQLDFAFDLSTGNMVALVPLVLPNAGQGSDATMPLTLLITIDNKGKLTKQTETIRATFGGLVGVLKGIDIPLVTPQLRSAAKEDFAMKIESLEFSRADNPDLPNLDASNPELVFRLENILYKDGRFSVGGGSTSIGDWSVGNAFKLTNQRISILTNEARTATTMLISSTLTFPTGTVAQEARSFPMAIRVAGQEQSDGKTTAAVTGTLITSARPTLGLGPLNISTPAKTELIFSPAQNFFGLQADQVTLRWDGELGSGAGVQTGFKLGIDKTKKLVFGLGAGGAISLPDIRSRALTLQLRGSLASANDVTTFTLNGTARLALPSNSNVAPGVTMVIRGGKNVRDTCSAGQTGCLKRFEYRLSSFELKLGGFGIGLTNAQGTADGGFAVEKATLAVPLGIKSFGGSISGFKVTGDGDISITGGSVELPPLQIGSFSLVGVKGTFVKNAAGYEFRGAGTVPLPGLDPSGGPNGKRISGEVIVKTRTDGSFTGFGVTVEFNTNSPGIPIGTTGMELVGLRSSFDVNAGTVKIGVGIRASSQLRIASLPVVTVDGNAQLQFNPFQVTANAKLSVLVLNVAEASLGIGHAQGFAGAPGFNVSFTVDLTLVEGGASLRIGDLTLSDGRRQRVVAAKAFMRVGIKKNQIVKFVPPVNIDVASVEFDGGHFRVKGRSDTVGLIGRVKVNMPLFIPDIKLSVFVDLNGPDVDVTDTDDYTLLGADLVRLRAAQGVAGYTRRPLSLAERQALNLSTDIIAQQETIPVLVDHAGMALFGISYPQGSPTLRLRLPDGTILTEQTIDQTTSGFLRETGTLTEEHQLAFVLANAQPGTYSMIVDNTPAVYDKVSYVLNAEPTIDSLVAGCSGPAVEGVTVNCDGAATGSRATVSWTAQDTDSLTATIRVGYVPIPADGSAPNLLNQTTLAEGLALTSGSFTWELGEVPSGQYRLIVSAEDGQHPAVVATAPTLVAVDDKRAPSAPSGLKGEALPGELLMTWSPNTEKDLTGYEIGFGVVQAGVADSPDNFIYSRDMGAKTVAITASNVLDARLWGLTDDQEVFVGIRAYDQSGNQSAWSPLLRAKPWALAPDAWTPAPGGTLPSSGQLEVAFASPLSLPVDAAVPAGLLEVRRTDGSVLAGSTEVITNLDRDQVAGLRFTPAAPLRVGATYMVVVKGGAGGVTSTDGRQMAQDYQWSFQVVAAAHQVYLPLVLR